MGRKPVEVRITPEDVGVKLVMGDIIEGAEELGVVVSARMDVRGENAVVYFMGGDAYKETFGVPQTLTVLRDPEGPEYEWVGRPIGTHVMVELTKAGGGTVGRRYAGDWKVRITRKGKVICDDVMRVRSKALTHEEAAREALCFVDEEYAATWRDH